MKTRENILANFKLSMKPRYILTILTFFFLCFEYVPFLNQICPTILKILFNISLVLFLLYFLAKRSFLVIILFALLPFLEVIYYLLHGTLAFAGSVKFLYGKMLWIIPILLSLFLKENFISEKEKKEYLFFTLSSVCVMFFLTGLTSIIGLMIDPNAARLLATFSSSDDPLLIEYNLRNIGGFSIVYSAVTLIPLLIGLLKGRKMRIAFGFQILFVLMVYIIFSQYTLALFFAIFGLLSFPLSLIKKKKYIVYGTIVVILFSLIFHDVIGQMFYVIAKLAPNLNVYEKLMYLGDIFTGTTGYYAWLGQRLELYKKSLDTFFAYPLFGVLLKDVESPVGGHSFLLDLLGMFGVVGFVAYFIFLFLLVKVFYKKYRGSEFIFFMVYSLVVNVMLGIVNPINFVIIVAFISPMFGERYIDDKKYFLEEE